MKKTDGFIPLVQPQIVSICPKNQTNIKGYNLTNYKGQVLSFHMNTNAWNLRGTKERLDILERTQAHKRHLVSVLSAKSKINTHGTFSFRQPTIPINLLRKKIIADDNRNLARKLASFSRPSPQRLNTSLSLSRNLKTYSSLNRNIKQRTIEQQNNKLLSRLITTSATLQRQKWTKSNQEIVKYKENLVRGKYWQPDYSRQACKLICREPKFKCLHVSASERGKLHKRPKVL